ncbi:MAG: hypothetical protein M8866_01020, partial [marine benthic group bacterium]|nr:hypothetical protein [Candidatus Benthicola marisminoris]
MRTRLVNLRVPVEDAGGGGPDTRPADILIEDGRIAAITAPSERPREADEARADLADQLVLPGAIDGHVHFDD